MTATFADIREQLNHQDSLLYQNDQLFTGTLTKNHKNFVSIKNYVNGILHGLQKKYYLNGQLQKISLFTNGVANGRSIEYFVNGSKKINANYQDGHLEGIYEEWDDEGILTSRKTYYNGKLIVIKNLL